MRAASTSSSGHPRPPASGRWRALLRHGLPALLVVFAAGALWAVPGPDRLNYYFALVMSLPASLAGVWVGLLPAAPGRYRTVWGTALQRSATAVAMTAGGAVVMALHAPWARTCDWAAGLAWYALGPLCSAAIGAAATVALFHATRRRRRAAAITAALAVLGWARHAWRFYSTPAVSFYDPFLGFLSGAIYDDAITPTRAYLWFRLTCAVGVVAFVATASWWRRRTRPALWFAAAVAMGFTALVATRAKQGWEHSTHDVQAALGGYLRRGRVAVWYDRRIARADRYALRLALAEQVHLRKLEQLFDAPFRQTLTSYVYATAHRRRSLMGADKVTIAKPWQRTVHLVRPPPASPLVRHELAHVYLGQFAPAPLHVPARWGVFPRMALIEGMAVAAEGYRGLLSLHQWAAALQELGDLPSMTALLGTGGYTGVYGPKAYVAAGSFMRFLVERYGPKAVRRLYAEGDPADALGRDWAALERTWRGFLRDRHAVPIEAVDVERARDLYEHPAILQRVCPVAVALSIRAASTAQAQGRFQRAVQLRRQVLEWLGGRAGARLALARTLAAAGQLADAEQQARHIAREARPRSAMWARAIEVLGDIAWRRGDRRSAVQSWDQLTEVPLSPGELRRIEAKRWCARARGPATLACELLLPLLASARTPIPRAWVDARITAAVLLAPHAPVPRWLAIRSLARRGLWPVVTALLTTSRSLDEIGPWTRIEARRLEALGLAHLGRCNDDTVHYALAVVPARLAGLRAAVREEIEFECALAATR